MKNIMDYIDSSMKKLPQNKDTEKFRLNLVSEVTERANEITHAGLSNEKIIDDIIISEHPDIVQEYKDSVNVSLKRKRRRQIFMGHILLAVAYFIAVTFGYLFMSFSTKDWGHTWVFLVGAVLVFITFILIHLVSVLRRKENFVVTQLPRLLLPMIIFLDATAIFLHIRILGGFEDAWVTFIAAVIVMFIVDGIYVEKTAERFAIIFHLLYIVPAFAMFYVFFSGLGVIPWSRGWIMIPCSVIILIVAIVIRLIIHSKADKRLEVEDEWQKED